MTFYAAHTEVGAYSHSAPWLGGVVNLGCLPTGAVVRKSWLFYLCSLLHPTPIAPGQALLLCPLYCRKGLQATSHMRPLGSSRAQSKWLPCDLPEKTDHGTPLCG